MDAKITKKRLSRMLSYDWLKIVALAVAIIFIWVLVFTTTATRVTPAQQFTVFNYSCNGSLTSDFSKFFNKTLQNGTFSYEVIEKTTNDLTISSEYAATILQARVSVQEGDVMFIPNIGDTSTAYTEEGGEETLYHCTYVETFTAGYSSQLYDLDPNAENGYFYQMKAYLNGYYTDWETGAGLDEEKIEKEFVARIKRNNDKRFKTKEQIEKGKADEVARIKKYRDALDTFLNVYCANDLVQFIDVTLKDMDGTPLTNANGDTKTAKYAMNICPEGSVLESKLQNLIYYKTDTDLDTSRDMCVQFFKFRDVTDGFQYESLLFLNALIAECLPA